MAAGGKILRHTRDPGRRFFSARCQLLDSILGFQPGSFGGFDGGFDPPEVELQCGRIDVAAGGIGAGVGQLALQAGALALQCLDFALGPFCDLAERCELLALPRTRSRGPPAVGRL